MADFWMPSTEINRYQSLIILGHISQLASLFFLICNQCSLKMLQECGGGAWTCYTLPCGRGLQWYKHYGFLLPTLKKSKILILPKNFQICPMHSLRQTNHTYVKSLPFLGYKCSHTPLNLEVYLKVAVANACCFWWEQTNGHAWLHCIPPRCTHIRHGHVFPLTLC